MGQWDLTRDEQAALLTFLKRLVQTPSLSGQEGDVAALVMDEMQRLGFSEVKMDAAGNVLGRIGPASTGGVMLNSHMDTVAVSASSRWACDPFASTLEQGRLYGLGACDMKGGLAATVHGAALLAKRQVALRQPVWVVAVGLEESSEGTGTRCLFEEDGMCPDYAVIAEPSDLQIVRAQRGHMELRLTVRGQSAHSSTPDLGKNAIYDASRLVFGLELLSGQLMHDPFLGPGVLAVTAIQSDAVSRNAVPDRCELIIDRRLTVGESEAIVLLEIERVITREGVDAEVEVIEEAVTTHTGKTYQVRRASMPWALDERHPLVQAGLSAARGAGIRPSVTRWQFATEGTYTATVAQVPTIGMGPGDPSLPHRCNEYVEIRQAYRAASFYAALSSRLVGEG
jgi:putative selenium metabolism hydrolase